MWVRWARLSIVHKIGGLFLKVWHFWHSKKFGTCQKFGLTGKKVPKVPLTTPRPPPPLSLSLSLVPSPLVPSPLCRPLCLPVPFSVYLVPSLFPCSVPSLVPSLDPSLVPLL